MKPQNIEPNDDYLNERLRQARVLAEHVRTCPHQHCRTCIEAAEHFLDTERLFAALRTKALRIQRRAGEIIETIDKTMEPAVPDSEDAEDE